MLPECHQQKWGSERLPDTKGKEQPGKLNKQLVNVLENISDGFFALDSTLVVTFFNNVAERLLSRNRDDVLGKSLFEAFPETSGTVLEEKCAWVLREKSSTSFEIHFDRQAGAYRQKVKVCPSDTGLSVFFQPITERKQTEEALRTSENYSQAILAAIPDLIFRFSPDGQYLVYHAPNSQNLYVPPEKFMGKRVTDVLPGETGKKFLAHIQACLDSGQGQVFEYQLPFPEGPQYFEARMVRVSGKQEVLAIVSDITPYKQVEAAQQDLLAAEHEQRLRAETLTEVSLALTSQTSLRMCWTKSYARHSAWFPIAPPISCYWMARACASPAGKATGSWQRRTGIQFGAAVGQLPLRRGSNSVATATGYSGYTPRTALGGAGSNCLGQVPCCSAYLPGRSGSGGTPAGRQYHRRLFRGGWHQIAAAHQCSCHRPGERPLV